MPVNPSSLNQEKIQLCVSRDRSAPKELGRGVDRRTYAYSARRVLKVAREGESSRRANRREWNVYTERPELREFLAKPIAIAADAQWLLMERAKCFARAEVYRDLPFSVERTELGGEIENSEGYRRLRGLGFHDLHLGNVGYVMRADNSGSGVKRPVLVIVDYAS